MLILNLNLVIYNVLLFIVLIVLLTLFNQYINSLISDLSIVYVSSGSSDEGSPKPLPSSSSLDNGDRPMTSRQAIGIFDEDDRPMTSRQALEQNTPITSREALDSNNSEFSLLERLLKRSHVVDDADTDSDSNSVPSKLPRLVESDKGKLIVFKPDFVSSKRSRLDSDFPNLVDDEMASKRIRLDSSLPSSVDTTTLSSKRPCLESGTDLGVTSKLSSSLEAGTSSKRPRLDPSTDLGVTSNLDPSSQVSSGSSSPLRALTSSAVGSDNVFGNSPATSEALSVDEDYTPYVRYLMNSNNYAIHLPRQELYRSYIEAARALRDVNTDPLVIFRHLSHGAALIRFLTPSHFALSGMPFFYVYPYTHSFMIYHIAINPHNALRPYVLRLVTNHFIIPHDHYRLAFDYNLLVPLVELHLDNDPFSGRDESTLLTYIFEFLPLDMSSIQILHIVFNNFGSF